MRGTSSANASLCIGLSGLIKSAIFEALGSKFSQDFYLFSQENLLALRLVRPVMLPPGRERLWTRPKHGVAYTYEYNRNGGSCRFQGYGCLRPGATSRSG